MKNIITLLCAALIILTACDSMDEINTNPNVTTAVPPSFLANNVILNMTGFSSGKWLLEDAWIMKTQSFTEHSEDALYNKFNRESFSNYHNIVDAQKMVEAAHKDISVSEGALNGYQGVYHFTRAYYFFEATMKMGDVPCSEALKGESNGVFAIKYDEQEKVFGTIIRELDLAAKAFSKASNFSGDIVYGGDPIKWQKLTHSFALRVLINLSNKTTVDGINVKAEFEKYSQKALMVDESDNFQRVYSSASKERYPFSEIDQNYYGYPVLGKFLVDMLKEWNDYRLFYYAEPAQGLMNEFGYPANSYDAYSGVDVTAEYGLVQNEYASGNGIRSGMNKRYHKVVSCEPTAIMSSSEVQFILAEAAVRKWTTPLTAKKHYNNGVTQAINFTFKYTPTEYQHGRVVDNSYIQSYLNGAASFNESATAEQQIEQIMKQKYIASFIQLKRNAYYDYRRTGYPKIPINPVTNMNDNPNKMPMRWMYPEREYSYNRENIEEAIKRQFGGSDSPTDIMWLLK